jgi:protease-4
MKHFIKIVTGSCLGTLIALLLVSLIIGIYITSASQRPTELKKESVLLLDLTTFIPEKTGNVSEGQFEFSTETYVGLNSIKKILKQSAEDPKINGILLKSQYAMGGQSTLLEIRNAILDFKESGKYVYSYCDLYSQSAYWLATAADSVWLNPNGYVDLKGYGVAIAFYKEMLEKVGVEMNIFYSGNFKSATEPYRRTSISDPNRKQTKAFLQVMEEVMLSDVGDSRNLSMTQLKEIMDEYQGGTAKGSLEANLVDGLLYWDEVESRLKTQLNISGNKKVTYVTLEEYLPYVKSDFNVKIKDRIAVVYAEGEILYGTKSKGTISDDKYGKIFDQIKRDKNVKAVVFRVNSPGGNSLVSDNIARNILDLKNNGIPVVASYGDYAASGGYYISAYADTIVASPNTLTGSIGVYVLFPNARKLLNEKLGIQFDTLKTSPYAVSFTPYFDLDDRESNHLQKFTDDLYKTFVGIVAEGRNMTFEEAEKIARGRVWTGKEAVQNGLVDKLGSLEDAISIAADMANISEYNVSEYPKIKENPWKEIIEALMPEESTSVNASLSKMETEALNTYNHLRTMVQGSGPQARLPYLFLWD